MTRHPEDCGEDDATLRLDAREIAPLLGLTPERLMSELRAGHVYHAAEEGCDRDDGRLRITFRYRARVARLIVDPDGSARPDDGSTN